MADWYSSEVDNPIAETNKNKDEKLTCHQLNMTANCFNIKID